MIFRNKYIIETVFAFLLVILFSIFMMRMPHASNSDFVIQNDTLVRYIGTSKNIIVPEGITTIGSCAFKDMTFITSVTLPSTLVYINYGGFANCSSLEKINLPNSLKSIGSYAFRNCFSLENIVIPSSVTTMGDSVFEGCVFLKIDSLPPNVQNIGTNIFKNANNIYASEILNHNAAIDAAYRTDEKALKYYTIVNYQSKEEQKIIESLAREITVNCSTDYEKFAAISDWVSSNIYYDIDFANNGFPPYNKGGSLKEIIEYRTGVCSHYSNLTMALLRSVGIPCVYMTGSTSVVTGGWDADNIDLPYMIGAHAWNRAYIDGKWIYVDTCWNSANEYIDGEKISNPPITTYLNATLKTMSRGHKFQEIDESIFVTPIYSNDMLNKNGTIIIPDCYDKISDWAFANCTNLTQIAIPDTIKYIGEGVFYKCTNLTDVVMPRNITSMGNNLFYGCDNLTSVVMPLNVPDSWQMSFRRCVKLEKVTLPKNITVIPALAFEGCTSLQSITIPDSVTSVEMGSFANCINLTTVFMSDALVDIEKTAFYNCPKLTIYSTESLAAEMYAKVEDLEEV